MTTQDINSLIDAAVNPQGGEPKVKGPALNVLLKSLITELIAQQEQTVLTIAQKADLDANGQVPSTQLPGYVDDVLEFESYADLPAIGEPGKIYLVTTGPETNRQYRFTGSAYVQLLGSSFSVEQDLASNSVVNAPSVKAVKDALASSSKGIADAITSNFTRTSYPDAQSAINGAGNNGTANIYAMAYASTGDQYGTIAALSFPATSMTVNIFGVAINTPDANTDVLTFRPGVKYLVNAYNTTITTSPTLAQPGGAGWTVTTKSNSGVYDLTINQLNINITGAASVAMYLTGAGTFNYSGNIVMQHAVTSQAANNRTGIQNSRGNLYAKGNYSCYGCDGLETTGIKTRTLMFALNNDSQTVWEGNLNAYEDVLIFMRATSTLRLRDGILDCSERFAGAAPLFDYTAGGATTVILENYAVLGRPEDEVIHADTVILRGNSVVVGKINSPNIIDERPKVNASTLEFCFNAGFADNFTTTITSGQAGTYSAQFLSNVASVAYSVNGVAATLPFTVAAGTTLQVTITRTDASLGCVVAINS